MVTLTINYIQIIAPESCIVYLSITAEVLHLKKKETAHFLQKPPKVLQFRSSACVFMIFWTQSSNIQVHDIANIQVHGT